MEDYQNENPYLKDGSEAKPKKPKTFGQGIAVGIAIMLVVLMAGGIVVAAITRTSSGDLLSSGVRQKLGYIDNILDKYYYEDISDEDKENALYKGLAESAGDPYTVYYTPDEYDDFEINTTGNYSGIGAALSQDKDTKIVTVARVYKGSPADEAGLKTGDIIVSADEYIATEMDLDRFVLHIRGEEGTTVDIKYIRENDEKTKEKTVTVTRRNITIPSVEYQMLDGNIGYIEIYDFASNTYDDYKKAMNDLTEQGMDAVIFDLRSNGGGLVDSVTAILDDILPEGTTVYMLDKNDLRTDYDSDEEHKIDIPIVVLVSGNTASAAEIFTGAIQDFDYGTVIGTQTFGKGIVQTTIPLADGSAMKVTTETYYTPKGRAIHGVGIAPDIELEYKSTDGNTKEYNIATDNQIQKAVEVLTKELAK